MGESYFTGPCLGVLPLNGSTSTIALNAAPASLQVGYAFIAMRTDILTAVFLSTTARAGTDVNISITIELQADSSGIPSGVALETVTKTSGWSTTAVHTEIPVSWSTQLTGGSRYWLVIKNASAAPTTDYITIGFRPLSFVGGTGHTLVGWCKKQYNGTTWENSVVAGSFGAVIVYGNGDSDGQVLTNLDANSVSGVDTRVYSGQETGVQFTAPPNGAITISGVAQYVAKAGSPTGTLQTNIYVNGSIVATSNAVDAALVSNTGALLTFVFLRSVDIPLSSVVAIVLKASGGDSTTNYFRNNTTYTVSTDSRIQQLKPFGGTFSRVQYASATWTTYPQHVPWVAVLLDNNTPISPAPINRRYR